MSALNHNPGLARGCDEGEAGEASRAATFQRTGTYGERTLIGTAIGDRPFFGEKGSGFYGTVDDLCFRHSRYQDRQTAVPGGVPHFQCSSRNARLNADAPDSVPGRIFDFHDRNESGFDQSSGLLHRLEADVNAFTPPGDHIAPNAPRWRDDGFETGPYIEHERSVKCAASSPELKQDGRTDIAAPLKNGDDFEAWSSCFPIVFTHKTPLAPIDGRALAGASVSDNTQLGVVVGVSGGIDAEILLFARGAEE